MYKKILVSKNSPENHCYAKYGEPLIIAQEEHEHLLKRKIPEDHHFFIGVESKQPSRYGWVKDIDYEVTPEELSSLYDNQPSKDLVESCKMLLDAVSKQNNDTPMACTFLTTIKKERILRVHKIIFYKERKEKGSE